MGRYFLYNVHPLSIAELLKTSRNSELKSGLFDSSHTETYEEMLHREFSLSAAQNSTLGIAEALTEQFSSKIGEPNNFAYFQSF